MMIEQEIIMNMVALTIICFGAFPFVVLFYLFWLEPWLEKRRKCAEKKGIKYCDECEQWPCEFLKRPVLVPVDLKGFREFMEKQEK